MPQTELCTRRIGIILWVTREKNALKYKAHKNLIIEKVYLTTNLFFIEFPRLKEIFPLYELNSFHIHCSTSHDQCRHSHRKINTTIEHIPISWYFCACNPGTVYNPSNVRVRYTSCKDNDFDLAPQ